MQVRVRFEKPCKQYWGSEHTVQLDHSENPPSIAPLKINFHYIRNTFKNILIYPILCVWVILVSIRLLQYRSLCLKTKEHSALNLLEKAKKFHLQIDSQHRKKNEDEINVFLAKCTLDVFGCSTNK